MIQLGTAKWLQSYLLVHVLLTEWLFLPLSRHSIVCAEVRSTKYLYLITLPPFGLQQISPLLEQHFSLGKSALV